MGTEKEVDISQGFVVRREGESLWHLPVGEKGSEHFLSTTVCGRSWMGGGWLVASIGREWALCEKCGAAVDAFLSSSRPSGVDRARIVLPLEDHGVIDGQRFHGRAELHTHLSRSVYLDVDLPVPESHAPRSMRIFVGCSRSNDGSWSSPTISFSDTITAPYWPICRGAVDQALSLYARTFESAKGEG